MSLTEEPVTGGSQLKRVPLRADLKEYQKKRREEGIEEMLRVGVFTCTDKISKAMSMHVLSDNTGTVIDIRDTWMCLHVAARLAASVPDLSNVLVASFRDATAHPIQMMSKYLGVDSLTGRWVPGTLTNRITKNFKEPQLIIIGDVHMDARAVMEAARANVPVIALAGSDATMTNVDFAIPCNNRSPQSLALIFWLLTREIMYLRGMLSRSVDWEVPAAQFQPVKDQICNNDISENDVYGSLPTEEVASTETVQEE